MRVGRRVGVEGAEEGLWLGAHAIIVGLVGLWCMKPGFDLPP